ncbi:MAG TPA: CocE/NonD family hydrolase [Bryobacteraceae bacterium]|nr:CocE/NonD family hydrolase [Bryobacteraceae bacterium]
MTARWRWCLVLALLCCAAACADDDSLFIKTEAMIPVRDGIRLHTVIFTPRDAHEPLPVLLERTPYGAAAEEKDLLARYPHLIADGYIFAFQDIRGRFKSEGQFVMQRQVRDRSDPKAIDESTDTYDTIQWLLDHAQGNNGRVGMLGISYGGWLVTMALLDPHPALKAASEQASPADMFLGDDFHHNGAFRLSYGFEYAALLETSKETNTHFAFDRADTYQWYLTLGALPNVDALYFHGKIPTWNDFVEHPDYDEFWRQQAFAPHIGTPKVPNLNVAGWWDQEDFYGPVKIYELFEKNDRDHLNYLVAGPWNHGGWARRDGTRLGEISFDSNTSKYFRTDIEAPWFAYWLKDKGTRDFPEAMVFQTGSNHWEQYNAWPPRNAHDRKLYLRADGALSFDPPADEGEAFDSYLSDPAHPVPYRHRPISPTYPGGGWPAWLVEDQRFVDNRPDVLSWESAPLKDDLKIAGDIAAELYCATTGSDSDWVAKVIDVYPEYNPEDRALDGYELMIADEILRGRFRDGFEHPKPIVPNQVTPYHIDLHTNDHAFLKGHRIMVQVQSTWFPLYDRNPQTFVGNIFKASASDYRAATQRVFRSKAYPSHIVLPVVR